MWCKGNIFDIIFLIYIYEYDYSSIQIYCDDMKFINEVIFMIFIVDVLLNKNIIVFNKISLFLQLN
jgi:hypothetical protein